jgi:hypothetical protein
MVAVVIVPDLVKVPEKFLVAGVELVEIVLP